MLVDCHPKMVLDTRLLKLRHRNYISCTYLILKKGLILKKKSLYKCIPTSQKLGIDK